MSAFAVGSPRHSAVLVAPGIFHTAALAAYLLPTSYALPPSKRRDRETLLGKPALLALCDTVEGAVLLLPRRYLRTVPTTGRLQTRRGFARRHHHAAVLPRVAKPSGDTNIRGT